MSSFRQSRGRIFFDTLCAFGMSASCAVAWMQTYSTALLGASGIAGFYGLVRFTDMFRRAPSVVEQEPALEDTQDVESVPVLEPEVVSEPAAAGAEYHPQVPEPLVPAPAKHELPPEVVAALVRKPKRKTKKPAKADRAVEETAASEPTPPKDSPPAPERSEPEAVQAHPESEYTPPIAPLFEPEPFMRQHQRAAFGRKFGVR
jgi:hypothetical protein